MARRVMTEAGAKYFGLPIGAVIAPDKEDEAKARHGGRPAPPGSVSGTNQRRAGGDKELNEATRPKGASKKESEGAKQKIPFSERGFKKPTISGPVPVLAGKGNFSAPEGSSVYKSPKHPGRLYVVTPDGSAHVITSQGELNLTPAERSALAPQVQREFEQVVEGREEATGRPATYIRLKSLLDQIEQAESVGNDDMVEDLMDEFRSVSNELYPEEDPRSVKQRINKQSNRAKGKK